ncbi:hypothetical protein ASE78_17605 [Sphingomonas sp. Leaf25]|nr:hypothetical protein ASE78_17605 [Sphingomonas sp. Leaf25]
MTNGTIRDAVRPFAGLLPMTILTMLAACGGGSAGGGSVTPPPSPPPVVTRDAFGCITGEWRVAGGVPAETRYQTDHFAFHWTGDVVAQADAVKVGQALENVYRVYATTIGLKPPQCESSDKMKININIAGDNGINVAGSRNGTGYIDANALGFATPRTVAHELVHVFQSATPGWTHLPRSFWETHANYMVAQLPDFRGDVDCSEDAVNAAYLAHGNARTRYCGWQFWDRIAQKYGYDPVNAVWTATGMAGDQYATLAATRGWSAAQLNDEFGDWAIRNVTWDYVNRDGYDRGAVFRSAYGGYEPDTPVAFRARRLTTLEPIDLAARRFAVPAAWAPQRWGYNLVRLVPDPGASTITVAFRGVTQAASATPALPGGANEPLQVPPPGSGWRWSVVIVDAQGAPRYAPVLQGGDESQSVAIRADDRAAYLMVMATPVALQHLDDDQVYYSVYRYPWMVQVDGAMPWGYQRDVPDRIAGGVRHPNGNGWVGPAARVDPSVYVGPYARVYGGTVTGNARIEDHAILMSGAVGDRAQLAALTTLGGTATVTGTARIGGVFDTITGNGFALSGSAQLLGDVQIYGDNRQIGAPLFTGFATGVYYGMILQTDGNDPARGALRTAPVPEVTAVPDYRWR